MRCGRVGQLRGVVGIIADDFQTNHGGEREKDEKKGKAKQAAFLNAGRVCGPATRLHCHLSGSLISAASSVRGIFGYY